MDKSKMAKEGTVIHYDCRKGPNGNLSRPLETPCGEWCCCDKCCNEGNKSLDDTLDQSKSDDICCPCC
jgi:hypothetical protein